MRKQYDGDERYFAILLDWHRTGRWRSRVDGVLQQIEPHLRPGARVLDVGCAIGTFALALARRDNVHVVALDFSMRALAIVQEVAHAEGVAARIAPVASAAEAIAFRDASFDLIVAADVLEHLVEPDAFLREAHRLLRPGGVLVLETPNTCFRNYPAYPRLRRLADRLGMPDSRIVCPVPQGESYEHYHIAMRAYPELLAMVRRAGLAIASHRPFGWWLELRGLDRLTRMACRVLRPIWPTAGHYADTDVLVVGQRRAQHAAGHP
jgi:ubiquinone/menaquinone biosynthesis C-methylase UbiE